MTDKKINIEVSWASLWRALFFIVLVAIMFLGRQILLGLFLAIVISSGLEAPISFLERRGIPRTIGAVLIFLMVILGFVFAFYAILPILVADIRSTISSFNEFLSNYGLGPLFDTETIRSINNLINRITTGLLSEGGSSLGFFSQILGGLGLILAVIFSSFYLSLSRDGVQRFLRVVLPTDYEDTAIKIYERSRKQIGRWFQTQILLSLVVGTLVWIALVVLKVKHAFLLAVLAAFFEIVPYVGPILAGTVAVLVALSVSAPLAIYTLIVFLVIHQLENHVLVPIFMRRSVGLHPVIVIIALLMGVEVGGFLGLIIAVPAAAVFQEVIDEWSSKKKPRSASV